MTAVASGVVEVDGGSLAYDAAGAGDEALLLLHAGLWDRRTWNGSFERLSERFRVVRYDARGHGGSPAATEAFSPARDATAVLDALGLERAHVIGCSMGGAAAIDMALGFPERVRSLVLLAPALSGHEWAAPVGRDKDVDEAIEHALRDGDLDRVVDLGLALWARDGANDPVGSRLRQIALENKEIWLLDESLERRPHPPAAERLGEIDVPALILLGDNDYAEMAVIAERLRREMPSARLERIENADHVVNMRRPELFERAVFDWVQEVARADAISARSPSGRRAPR